MKRLIYAGAAAGLFALSLFAQDPPSRIARLNYIGGNVSMQPAGTSDWSAADVNRPFTTGDTAYLDAASRAEFHLDTAVLRAGDYTSFGFLTLDDQSVQLRLTEGDLCITVRELDANQTFEVDTPNAAVSLLRTGVYRFRIASNGALTFVVVRQGQAEITGGGQAFNLTAGNSASISGSGDLSYVVGAAPEPDDFDLWSRDRDEHESRLDTARYLPPSVVGYEELDQYGGWQSDPAYGHIWYPRTLVPGWAPYRYGHWAWIEPWGWTWIDDAPWGFAPFHYGRWAYVSGRWGWCPGPLVVIAGDRRPVMRPVYSPALVAWFGGPHVSVAIGAGGPSVGWVPLSYGEVYTPSYRCSPRYFNNVNVSNTTVVKTVNITNVYQTVYVNKTVYNQRYVNTQAPNAITAMPQGAFSSGRPVGHGGVSVPPHRIQSFQTQGTAVVTPSVAPTRQALAADNVNRPAVARPPAQVLAQKVVVRNTPAASPSPFANRQPYLQQHAGQPHDFPAMHQQVAPPQPAAPQFTHAPPVTRVSPVMPAPPATTAPRREPDTPVQVHPAPRAPAPVHAAPPAHNVYPVREPPASEKRPPPSIPKDEHKKPTKPQ